MNSVRSRIINGIKANLLGQGSTIVIQILSVPLFLSFWGAEAYGVWVTLYAIPSYLSISDLGFGAAAANAMAIELARGDRNKAVEVFQTVWIFATFISALVCALSVCIILAFPVQSWLNITLSVYGFEFAALFLILYSIGVLQCNVIHAGFKSTSHYPLGTTTLNLIRLVEWILAAIAVAFGANILGSALTLFLLRFLGTVGFYFQLTKINPWLVDGFPKFRKNIIKDLAVPALTFLGLPLGNAINNQGMLLVIANHISPTAVASFAALRTLCRFSFQFMNTIRFATWPEISKAYGEDNLHLVRALHRRCCNMSFWIVLILVGILGISGERIFNFWTGNALVFERETFFLMLLLMVTNTLWFSSSVIHTATNKHAKLTSAYVGLVSLSIIAASLFMPKYGVVSAASSLLAVDIAMVVYVFYGSSKILKEELFPMLAGILKAPFVKNV